MSGDIEGFDDLMRAFKELSSAATPSDLKEAGDAGADVLLRGMRRRVPVDTGELRDSLELALGSSESHEVTVAIRSDSDHAEPVEFGTRHQHAQPYMRPTIDEDGNAATQTLADVLRRKIEQVAS